MAIARKAFANRRRGEVYGVGKWRLLASGETDNQVAGPPGVILSCYGGWKLLFCRYLLQDRRLTMF